VMLALSLVVSSRLRRWGTAVPSPATDPSWKLFQMLFWGVLMPEVELLAAPRFKRGHRFDWLYDQMVTTGRLESLLSRNLDLPDVVWQSLRPETDHELRAALICLLTAALAAKGTARSLAKPKDGGSVYRPGRCESVGLRQEFA
jgi:hypothetical protein